MNSNLMLPRSQLFDDSNFTPGLDDLNPTPGIVEITPALDLEEVNLTSNLEHWRPIFDALHHPVPNFDDSRGGEEIDGRLFSEKSPSDRPSIIRPPLDIKAEGGRYGNGLHEAAVRGYDDVVQVLLDKGADVNAKGGRYGNALQAASVNNHEKVIQMLLDAGADANVEGGSYIRKDAAPSHT